MSAVVALERDGHPAVLAFAAEVEAATARLVADLDDADLRARVRFQAARAHADLVLVQRSVAFGRFRVPRTWWDAVTARWAPRGAPPWLQPRYDWIEARAFLPGGLAAGRRLRTALVRLDER